MQLSLDGSNSLDAFNWLSALLARRCLWPLLRIPRIPACMAGHAGQGQTPFLQSYHASKVWLIWKRITWKCSEWVSMCPKFRSPSCPSGSTWWARGCSFWGLCLTSPQKCLCMWPWQKSKHRAENPRKSKSVRSDSCKRLSLMLAKPTKLKLSSLVRNWHEWEPPTAGLNLFQVSFAFVDLVNQPGKASLASVAEQWLLHTTSSTSLWLVSCEVVTSHHLEMADCNAKAANLDTKETKTTEKCCEAKRPSLVSERRVFCGGPGTDLQCCSVK